MIQVFKHVSFSYLEPLHRGVFYQFPFSGFITMTVINPVEKKLANAPLCTVHKQVQVLKRPERICKNRQ